MRSSDSSTNFPPAGQPKEDPKQTLGKTMQELIDEKGQELDEKMKKRRQYQVRQARKKRYSAVDRTRKPSAPAMGLAAFV